jgi:flagellar biosynthesis protein FlhF
MRLRTFFAKNMKDALTAMRAELGEEAIIVASETMRDGTLILRAGVEDGGLAEGASEDASSPQPPPPGDADGPRMISFESQYRKALLARLRVPSAPPQQHVAMFDRAALLAQLVAHRVPDALAASLAAESEDSGFADPALALSSVLDRRMRSDSFSAHTGRAILLIGPPGAGKTSVAAKLAAESRLAGFSVRLATTDLVSAGQAARLESFARCLNVDVFPAPTAETLGEALHRSREDKFLLIADSAGCHPNESVPTELRAFLSMAGDELDIVGVVSASGDAEEAAECAAHLANLGAVGLVLTGLDLPRRKGALLSLALSELPVVYTTASPYLADGLQTLTPLALSRALLAGLAPGAARLVA